MHLRNWEQRVVED